MRGTQNLMEIAYYEEAIHGFKNILVPEAKFFSNSIFREVCEDPWSFGHRHALHIY